MLDNHPINVSVTFNEKGCPNENFSSQTSRQGASLLGTKTPLKGDDGKKSSALLATRASIETASLNRKSLLEQRSNVIVKANQDRGLKIMSSINQQARDAIQSHAQQSLQNFYGPNLELSKQFNKSQHI